MKKAVLFTLFLFLSINFARAAGDTVVVQTFTFGSPQNAKFLFPSDTVSFEKILMMYTLKCNPAQSPACGEWDYLTNTYVYRPTGLLDTTFHHQPTFLVNGSTRDSLPYSTVPTTYTTAYTESYVVRTSTTSLNTYTVGTGNTASAYPFGASAPVSRSRYIWRASELTAAGMAAGNITGMQFFLQSLGSDLFKMTIRMKAVTADSLRATALDTVGFTTVYSRKTFFGSAGWNSLQFLNSFNWNGTSNILVEVTYDNTVSGADVIVAASNTTFKSGLVNKGSDRVLSPGPRGFLTVPMNSALQSIDSNITVSFWAYGDPLQQPMSSSLFEALGADLRLLNLHCPWSDSYIYWDAGNNGSGYDRASRSTVNTGQIRGQWNHWAFAKNSSGRMRMYLNGNIFLTVTAKTKPMSGIDAFRLGRGFDETINSYRGRIDDFTIFKADLDLANIQAYMYKPVDASHPNYADLVMQYNFNEGNYLTANDLAAGSHPQARYNGGADNPLKSASDLLSNFTETTLRPNVIFEQGVYTSSVQTQLVQQDMPYAPVQVITYTDSINNPGAPVDTMLVWPPQYFNYLFSTNGVALDSTRQTPDGILRLKYYDYQTYAPDVERFELARYITPYGIGLDLGTGWTWTFDVSDYRTLLKDSVWLSAGNWQELLDVKFLMIKGTPPRPVLDIKNLWNGNFDYGVPGAPIDNNLTAKTVLMPANAANARWKSRVTGHGMDTPSNCAEFCPKTHYYKVNGTQRYNKLVWRDNCDLNPLYPQGGTWVYDRSNWCPGAEVWTYDWEISPWVTPGSTFTLDHDVQAYTHTSGWDYYQIEDQVVFYGAPNHSLDVAMEMIQSPSNNQMWKRMNPICSSPVVVIKNTGTTSLTSCTITYGLKGATPSTYNWTGSLAFMQTATVTLGNFNWIGNANEFYAYVSSPNGGTDQYAKNDTIRTAFAYPPSMPSRFVIQLKSNSSPAENNYTLKNDAGVTIFSRTGLIANTTYNDTLNLAPGCYKFQLNDNGEDGLSWWANTAQGSGTISFRSATVNSPIISYNPDFGGQVYQQFTVGLTTGIEDYILAEQNQLFVYPNPARDVAHIAFNLVNREKAEIFVFDQLGKQVYQKDIGFVTAGETDLQLSSLTPGIYFVKIVTPSVELNKKLVVE